MNSAGIALPTWSLLSSGSDGLDCPGSEGAGFKKRSNFKVTVWSVGFKGQSLEAGKVPLEFMFFVSFYDSLKSHPLLSLLPGDCEFLEDSPWPASSSVLSWKIPFFLM